MTWWLDVGAKRLRRAGPRAKVPVVTGTWPGPSGTRVRRLRGWCTLALVAVALPLLAQSSSPAESAPVFKKLLDYDRTASGRKGAYVVLVVHDGDPAEANEIIAEFRKVGVAAISAPVPQLPSLVGRAAAAFVTQGAARPEVLLMLEQAQVLTLSSHAALVTGGQVSLGVARGNSGRPEIVVHLARLKREGHQLPASVLQLARVVR